MKKAVIKLIEMYRKHISAHTPPKCRFTPTCSEYAILAVEKYGVVIGLMKALWRIFEMQSLSKGGYDPLK